MTQKDFNERANLAAAFFTLGAFAGFSAALALTIIWQVRPL